MKKISLYLLLFVSFMYFVPQVYAEYVLPYPSFMPGNKIYRVSRMMDTLKNYWNWGTIAQIKYHLSLSDKYLVEAKTLFEYKQYLLAADAITRSDAALVDITSLIEKGMREGKDMSVQKTIVVEAMKTHVSTIEYMKQWLPNEFQWIPEKAVATDLSIGVMLDTSIQIRNTLLNALQDTKEQYTYVGSKTAPWQKK
ncbi:MAG: hypothetical protein WAV51_02965 [Microgenomates group bacterium]